MWLGVARCLESLAPSLASRYLVSRANVRTISTPCQPGTRHRAGRQGTRARGPARPAGPGLVRACRAGCPGREVGRCGTTAGSNRLAVQSAGEADEGFPWGWRSRPDHHPSMSSPFPSCPPSSASARARLARRLAPGVAVRPAGRRSKWPGFPDSRSDGRAYGGPHARVPGRVLRSSRRARYRRAHRRRRHDRSHRDPGRRPRRHRGRPATPPCSVVYHRRSRRPPTLRGMLPPC
jgi:hypothetical protein